MKVTIKKDLEIYVSKDGKAPFVDWLESLKDKKVKHRVQERLDRVALGNLGDFKPITNGHGVSELRLSFGAGYRVYYGEKGSKLIILLCGGSKSTQKKDIKKAINYWLDYLSEED